MTGLHRHDTRRLSLSPVHGDITVVLRSPHVVSHGGVYAGGAAGIRRHPDLALQW